MSQTDGSTVFDCAIVGAGFAGVAAAYDLCVTHGVDRVVILEAHDRVGGRVHSSELVLYPGDQGNSAAWEIRTITPPSSSSSSTASSTATTPSDHKDDHLPILEHGGQWIGPQQKTVNRMVLELGLRTVKQYTDGKSILDYQPVEKDHDRFAIDMVTRRTKKPQAYAGIIPPLPVHALVDLQLMIWRTDHLAKQVPLDNPWDAPRAREWDSKTVRTYFEETLWTRAAMDMLVGFVQVVFCAEASEVSLLHFLWLVHSCDGVDALMNMDNGAQNFKIEGGAVRIAIEMLKRIEEKSDMFELHLSTPVVSINSQSDSTVELTAQNGTVFHAKRVILAVPPPMVNRIKFKPSLPPFREQLGQRMPMGTIIKISIVFKSAFWRDKGFCGFFMSNSGVLQFGFDMTTSPGIVGFIVGARARDTAMAYTREQRQEMIVEQLAFLFSCSEQFVQDELVYVDETNWTNVEHIHGAYFAYAPPGVVTTVGRYIREPIDRIHFAGTETATEHTGYFNGALQSGFRAAKEVVTALGMTE